MYTEIGELREGFGKRYFYRDHYCEAAIYQLLEKGIIDPTQQELDDVFEANGVYKIAEAGKEGLKRYIYTFLDYVSTY
jgi:hypothetical protein